MGIVGDIATLANKAYHVWCERKSTETVRPQLLLQDYIEPSYTMLKAVHADYTDFYLELVERIGAGESLWKTVRWFSRARSRLYPDRSELRFTDIPLLRGNREAARNFNDAVVDYLQCLRAYFLQGPHLEGSRSSGLELDLRAAARWLQLWEQEELVVSVNNVLEETDPTRPVSSDFTNALMRAVEREIYFATREERPIEPAWRELICVNTDRERKKLEQELAKVQKAIFRLRVLVN